MPSLHDYYTELGHINDALLLLSTIRDKLTLSESALLQLRATDRETILTLTQLFFSHAQSNLLTHITPVNAKAKCVESLNEFIRQLTTAHDSLNAIITATTSRPQNFTNPCFIEIEETARESNSLQVITTPSARAVTQAARLKIQGGISAYQFAKNTLVQVKKDLTPLTPIFAALSIMATLRNLSAELVQTETSFLKPFLLLQNTASESIKWIEINNNVILSSEERRVIESFFALKDKINNPLLFNFDEMQTWSNNLTQGLLIMQQKLAGREYQTHVGSNIPFFIRLNSAFTQMRQKLQQEPNFTLNIPRDAPGENALDLAGMNLQQKSLSEFLIFPVQRLTRYPLLFREMLEQISKANADPILQLCMITFAKQPIEEASSQVCTKLEKINREKAYLEKSMQLSAEQFRSAQFFWDSWHRGLHHYYAVAALSNSADQQTLRDVRLDAFDTLAQCTCDAEKRTTSKHEKERINNFLIALRLARDSKEHMHFTAEEFVAAYKAYHQDPLDFIFRWHGFKKACSITTMSAGTVTTLIGILALASLLTGPLAPFVATIGISTTLAIASLAGVSVFGTAMTLLGFSLLPTLPKQNEVKVISSVCNTATPKIPNRHAFHQVSRRLEGHTHAVYSNISLTLARGH